MPKVYLLLNNLKFRYYEKKFFIHSDSISITMPF